MICPQCQHENRPQAKFCEECATPLPRGCANCGSKLSAAAKFCSECGQPVAAGAVRAKSSDSIDVADSKHSPDRIAPSQNIPEGEQRQITVMFADISAFTRLSAELGAEATHDLLNHYFEAADRIVENYGGRVDKHIGDNVMAVFGAPVAHSDDPQRAIRAAMEIHTAMDAVSVEAGRPLQAHVGIATGQVVASGTGSEAHREYTVTGTTVNLASRLQNLAGPGETFVSDPVRRAIAETAKCEARGNMEIKGFEQPVPVWRVLELLSQNFRSTGRAFVGRQSELAQFAGVLSACRETGTGQTVFVRGEAGIGKTRLVEEFQRLAEQQGFAFYTSLVLDFGVGRGQDAIRTLVRSLLGITAESSVDERIAAVELACTNDMLDPDRRVYLNDLLDMPQPKTLITVYDAMDDATRNSGKQETVAELLYKFSAERPIVVNFEDIHWADAAMLAYLARLVSTVPTCPAILIMTSRIEGDPIDQAWRGSVGGHPFMTIDLAPLRNSEALELAGEYLETSNRFALTCIERAGGNPLFLDQLLQSMEETGAEDVPGSVQSLVQSRMDRLAAADRIALQAASVLGQRFSLAALCHLIGRPGYDCAGLVAHFLVRPVGKDFLFAHALVREGVYSSLLRMRRKELHRCAAEWFADQDPVLKAQHLDRAEDPAAGEAYLVAAQRQVAQYDYARARQLAERGLEIANDGETAYALTCLQGDILRALGDSKGSIAAFERALSCATDEAQRSKAWLGQAEGLRIVDRYDDAFVALDNAEAAAKAQQRTDHLTKIHFLRGNLYFPLGNIDGCLAQHQLALEYAGKAGSVENEARALGGLGDAYYQRGRMITANRHFRRCVELSREHGYRAIEVANLSMVGFSRFFMNEPRQALDDALATIDGALRVGHQRAALLGRILAYWVFVQMLDAERGRQQLDEAQLLVNRLGARRFEAQNLTNLAKLLRLEGRRSEALQLCQQAQIISRETGVGFIGPQVWAETVCNMIDRGTRRQALQEGERILQAGAVSHNHFYFYAGAMEACLETEEWEEVERYAAALEEFTRSEPLPWCDFYIKRGRLLASHGRGNRDESTMSGLRQLCSEAERVGLKIAMPALEAALC